MRIVAAAVAVACAVFAGPAAAQAAPSETFASLTLDFCGPAVSAAPDQMERIAAERGLTLSAWRTQADATGRYEQWMRSAMRTPAEERIRFVTVGAVEGEPMLAAVISESARTCLVASRGTANVDASLLTRLRDPAGEWQLLTTLPDNNSSIFEWPGLAMGDSASLYHWPSQPGQATRVLVNRRDLRVPPRVAQDVVATWTAHIVDVCARAVHERRDLRPEEFAPYMTLREEPAREGLALESADGQPRASVIINRGERGCLITSTGERARQIDTAILALAAERGLPPSDRPRTLRLPKYLIAHPAEARDGRDAYVSSGVMMGILMATVGDTRQ